MREGDRATAFLTAVLVIAAVAVAVANVYAVFFEKGSAGPKRTQAFTRMEDWERLLDAAILVGDPHAEIVVVEFADLECGFCQRFFDAFQEAKSEYGQRLALAYLHYPLGHPTSMQAAVAAECAERQGVFTRFLSGAFKNRSSPVPDRWTLSAREAGVEDIRSFESCLSEKAFPRIRRGQELVDELGLTGTPTVIINGWRFRVPPYDDLTDVIARILEGEEPR